VVGDRENTGWAVGWVEKDDNVYFFATLLLAQNPDETFVPKRLAITREILAPLMGLMGTERSFFVQM